MYDVTEKQIKIDERAPGVAVTLIFSVFSLLSAWGAYHLIRTIFTYEPSEHASPIAVKLAYAFFIVTALIFTVACFLSAYSAFCCAKIALCVYVFDQLGVSRVSPFGTRFIAWEDVKDYGISFEYTRRSSHFFIDIGKSYSFYVSDKVCPQKNYSKKDLSGVFFKLSFNLGYQKNMGYFAAREQGEYVRQTLAFCAEHTDIEPFIASNAHGLLDPVLESPSDKLKEKFRSKK